MQRHIDVDDVEHAAPPPTGEAEYPKQQEFDSWHYMQRKFQADDDEWKHFTSGGLQKGHHSKLHRALCWLVAYGLMPLLAAALERGWERACAKTVAPAAGVGDQVGDQVDNAQQPQRCAC